MNVSAGFAFPPPRSRERVTPERVTTDPVTASGWAPLPVVKDPSAKKIPWRVVTVGERMMSPLTTIKRKSLAALARVTFPVMVRLPFTKRIADPLMLVLVRVRSPGEVNHL